MRVAFRWAYLPIRPAPNCPACQAAHSGTSKACERHPSLPCYSYVAYPIGPVLIGFIIKPMVVRSSPLITFGVSLTSGKDAFNSFVMSRANSSGLILAARLAAIWRPMIVPPAILLPALVSTARSITLARSASLMVLALVVAIALFGFSFVIEANAFEDCRTLC